MNIQDWFPLGWTGWICLCSKGLSRVISNTTVQKHQSLALSLLYGPTLILKHDYWKTIALIIQTLVHKVKSLLFNMLSRFVIALHSRSKHLLISWLHLLSAVNLEHRIIKSVAVPTFSSIWCIKNILETGNCRCVVSAAHWVKKDMTPFNHLLIFDGPDSVFSRIRQCLFSFSPGLVFLLTA